MSLPSSVTYYPLGDTALVVSFASAISETTNTLIRRIDRSLTALQYPAIVEQVPAFASITIYYDSLNATFSEIQVVVEELLSKPVVEEEAEKIEKLIPVWYNGPDLEEVAAHTGMNINELIKLHSDSTYLVYMLGFVPGFPYLGGMDKRLSTPRKETPRLKIAPGSVGIAGEQTGVYPIETPGGWQIIGQTPLNLFDSHRQTPSFLSAGDRLRFVPIDEAEFLRIKGEENGN